MRCGTLKKYAMVSLQYRKSARQIATKYIRFVKSGGERPWTHRLLRLSASAASPHVGTNALILQRGARKRGLPVGLRDGTPLCRGRDLHAPPSMNTIIRRVRGSISSADHVRRAVSAGEPHPLSGPRSCRCRPSDHRQYLARSSVFASDRPDRWHSGSNCTA